jgi:hypothetical protein
MNPKTRLNNLPNPDALPAPDLTREEINERFENEKLRRESASYRLEVRNRLDNLLAVIEASLKLYLESKPKNDRK